jgi:hypothetical protein
MTATRLFFVPLLTDPALVLVISFLVLVVLFSGPPPAVRRGALPEIEKPPTQWTVGRRAEMWRA